MEAMEAVCEIIERYSGDNMVELTLQQARALVDELPAIYAMFSKYSESNFFEF